MSVWSPKTIVERSIGLVVLVVVAVAPQFFSDYWVDTIFTQTFMLGIVAASLIFLSAYAGMISLAQTALFGIAGYALGNMVTQRVPGGETKGLTLGLDPTLALVLALAITTGIGLLFGAIAARSYGIYFLMLTLTYGVIATYFFGQVTQFGGFSPIAGINGYTPGFIGDILNDRERLYYIALIVAIFVYVLIRFIVRTPFGYAMQGIRDEPVRMASLGYAVPAHRTLAFGLSAFMAALGGILYVWWQGQIAPQDVGLNATIDLLIIAVIGGLGRVEGAWLGAFTFIVINNYVRDIKFPGAEQVGELPIVGGSFNTIIGLIFLLIVIVSPEGLSGIWDRLWRLGDRRSGPDEPVGLEPSPTGQQG